MYSIECVILYSRDESCGGVPTTSTPRVYETPNGLRADEGVHFTSCGKKLATRGIKAKLEGEEMPLTKKEMKTFFSAEADTIIAKILSEEKPLGEMTLNDIEEKVMEIGQQFEALLTEKMIHAAEGESREAIMICPECGIKMRQRGYREKALVTRTGEVTIRRAYYRCEVCGRGIFPPG